MPDTLTQSADQNEPRAGGALQEFVAFRIGAQEFCVDIMSVREIRGFSPATPIPHAPSFVHGFINLRGTVLPIVDLAQRLGFAPIEPTERSVTIVALAHGVVFGLLVDGVSDILTVDESALQPPPDITGEVARRFISEVMSIDGRMLSVIDVDHVMPQLAGAA
ncbi:chemotaxis protein CheW [Pararhizobium mangrovi]|uniref:Purine-binding chemotaxis protein CheW n=1 Tax=Pararhizobium mangrovi TaxID=2590452 RepID=A0A506U599_9HYPH|nr:chemotaxis protein CheW [Pararhizobium mangrovi]TPW29030.1 purine-binding chemotaxis protein CheW [Pararhizobium mangrovi]